MPESPDQLRERIRKQSDLLQELKRDNFALRMDIVALLEGKVTPSSIQPGAISREVKPEESASLTRLKEAAAQASAGAGLLAMRTVKRVYRLRQRWLAAGPPPIGTSTSRWWDQRLVELDEALAEAIDPDMAEEAPDA